ncbi:MAG: multidrug efflux pump subunit AcrB [Bacteroidia bacterium]|jgi:multidrug efflux pump subunit AcrB
MSSLIRWFVANPIAANLLMMLIFIGGLSTLPQLDKEFFPQRKLNQIEISMSYPGANPAEVEKQIVLRIEEAVSDLDGISELRSTALEGSATVVLDIESGLSSSRLINDVKSRIESINSFPADAEPPLISERLWRSRMISLALYGALPEAELKELGLALREQIATLPHVSIVDLRSPRNYELAIEVPEKQLRKYGLQLTDIADAVKRSSINLSNGKLITADGDVRLQSRNQSYTAADFAQIPVLTHTDGSRLLIGDIATVNDGFEEINVVANFSGSPSLAIDVYVTTNPDVLRTSEEVSAFVEQAGRGLPEGVALRIWRDMSVPFKDRFEMLLSNGFGGLVLVFMLLLLFLRPLLAFWVCTGIAVAFLGAIWLLPVLGTSLNMVSLFAFILILGIVVDDAIIVGESIYTRQQNTELSSAENAIAGAEMVMKPVVFAVLSTIIFFLPFYFLPEEVAEPPNLADVVVLALIFSLLEALLILPAHLAHMPSEKPGRYRFLAPLENLRARFAGGLNAVQINIYQPLLNKAIARKGTTLIAFSMIFVLTLSFLIGGWIKTGFFPRVPGDSILATVTMRDGTPFSEVEKTMRHMLAATETIKTTLNDDKEIFAGDIESVAYNNQIRVTLELLNTEHLSESLETIRNRWRELIGPIPNANKIDFSFTVIPIGQAINLELSAASQEDLSAFAQLVAGQIAHYPGVFDVINSLEAPLTEIEVSLKPQAQSLGLFEEQLARQIRHGFYGVEAQKIPRLREDVRVMVRYPPDERDSIHDLRSVRLRTATGVELPFEEVAEIDYQPGYSAIARKDRQRVANITAELQPGFSTGATIASLMDTQRKPWAEQFPGASIQKAGQQQQQSEFMTRTVQLMVMALILSFGLMAIVFGSYWQPILIMVAIPFGFIGGLIGHILLQQELAMFSVLGMIACAGVVVNDNLVLIDRTNTLREGGLELLDALKEATRSRFRPIVLTSMTTFIGLGPIMLEGSSQAQFLKPMVIALAFGVLFATVVTLVLVPCLYLQLDAIAQSLQSRWGKLKSGMTKLLEYPQK